MTVPGRHLAVCILSLSGGGAQRRMLSLAHAFAVRGHRVDVVVVRSWHGSPRQDISPCIHLVALDPCWTRLPGLRKFDWALASVPALTRYLRREQPDVLLSCSHLVNVAAPWARYLARVRTRLVLRITNYLSPVSLRKRFQVWQARFFYPHADAIITNSKSLVGNVTNLLQIPAEHITPIYGPVATPELQEKATAALNHPWFAPGEPPVILGVGRLVAQKDFATLLRAFARVRAAGSVRLMILGEGKKRKELERLACDLGVSAEVALPGYVTNPFPYMARACVFALSSAWEGLPGVLIEALACGCPVVSTDCPSGPAEILDKGTYGPLVPVGDDAALAQALLSVLETAPDRNRLRQRAALFSDESAVDHYLEVLL